MVYQCITITISLFVYPIDPTVDISSYLFAIKLDSCLTQRLVIEVVRSIRVNLKWLD